VPSPEIADRIVIPIVISALSFVQPSSDPYLASAECPAEFKQLAAHELRRRNCFPNPAKGPFVGGGDSFEDNMAMLACMITPYVNGREAQKPILAESRDSPHGIEWAVGDLCRLADDENELKELFAQCGLEYETEAEERVRPRASRARVMRKGWAGIVMSIAPGPRCAEVCFEMGFVGTLTTVPTAALRQVAKHRLVGTHWKKEGASPPDYITFGHTVLTLNGSRRVKIYYLGNESCKVCWPDGLDALFEEKSYEENSVRKVGLIETSLGQNQSPFMWASMPEAYVLSDSALMLHQSQPFTPNQTGTPAKGFLSEIQGTDYEASPLSPDDTESIESFVVVSHGNVTPQEAEEYPRSMGRSSISSSLKRGEHSDKKTVTKTATKAKKGCRVQ